MKRPGIATLLRLACLSVAGTACAGLAFLAADEIEQRTEQTVEAALAEGGHDWVAVEADGMTAILGGTAPDEAARFRAMTAAGDTLSPANLQDRIEVAQDVPEMPDYRLEVLRSGGAVTVHGLLPGGPEARKALTADLGRRIGEAELSDLLSASASPAPPGWENAVDVGLLAAENLRDARVTVTPGHVDVEGLAESQSQAKLLSETLRENAAASEVALATDLKQPRALVSPFITRFRIDDSGPRFDACTAETPAERDRLIAAGERAGAEIDASTCSIGLGAPDPQWTEAAVMAIDALTELGAGTVTISDLSVILVADQDVDREQLSQTATALEDRLPPLFRLNVLGPSGGPEDETKAEASESGTGVVLIVTRSPEEGVALSGPIGDRSSREMVESYSAALFGTTADETFRLQPDLPNGWLIRVLAALEAFSHVDTGNMRVTPSAIAIRGTTGSKSTQETVVRSLVESLGQDAFYSVEISYDKSLDPEAALPTPQECVDRVNSILATDKITFAPGSTQLDATAIRIVARIAQELEGCQNARMEIGGHTDSQGRAEMNLSLSQQRADAVFNALLARRVLMSGLSAKGYGEEAPIADNDTEEGREENRRIEFTLLPNGDVPDETQ